MATESGTWKDNPVIIAAATSVASVGFTILVYKEVVVPTHTAQLQNEIVALKRQQGIPDNEAGGYRALRAKTEELEKKLKATQTQLAEAQHANLFRPGNPYPLGLEKVKLGDSVELLRSMYPNAEITQGEFSWKLEKGHTAFEIVTFNIDENNKLVEWIWLYASSSFPPEALHSKLVEAFGQPRVTTTRGTSDYSWRVGDIKISKTGIGRSLSIDRWETAAPAQPPRSSKQK